MQNRRLFILSNGGLTDPPGAYPGKTNKKAPPERGAFFMPFLFALIEHNVNNLKAQVKWG